jgi:hypothetical protein
MNKKVIHFTLTILIFTFILNAQSISGTVKDALLGYQIEGATVTILELEKSYKVGIDGTYAIDSIEPGKYTIRAEAPGYLKLSKRIILKSDKDIGTSNMKLDLKLYSISSKANSFKGTMTVKYYFPGHGTVKIVVYDEGGNRIRRAFDRSRCGGMCSFSWDGKDDLGEYVKPGRYTCRISRGTMVINRELFWKGEGAGE